MPITTSLYHEDAHKATQISNFTPFYWSKGPLLTSHGVENVRTELDWNCALHAFIPIEGLASRRSSCGKTSDCVIDSSSTV